MKYRVSHYKYINNIASRNVRPIHAESLSGISQVVVIPCYAESRYIFKTLASLSKNPEEDLKKSLILCVVNNGSRKSTDETAILDNQCTMECLDMLITGHLNEPFLHRIDQMNIIKEILQTKIRISYIDASSEGSEMPDKGSGVGLARKIGLDHALTIIDYHDDVPHLLYNLDADTIVENNYLPAVRAFFINEQAAAAAYVAFTHQDPEEAALQSAIICYEIFLRYYVAGLRYSGSVYAHHSVGSTMVCTADGYAAVRGMNRRQAGEDFYFLNKMAKLGAVKSICTTTVYPSARPSHRVPFGTGRTMLRSGHSIHRCTAYHPDVFVILKKWLASAECAMDKNAEGLMRIAENIDPLLASFLDIFRFPDVWPRICKNNRNRIELTAKFHDWFDGFKTMKFIHYYSHNGKPPIDMFDAVKILLGIMNHYYDFKRDSVIASNIAEQKRLLEFLRKVVRV